MGELRRRHLLLMERKPMKICGNTRRLVLGDLEPGDVFAWKTSSDLRPLIRLDKGYAYLNTGKYYDDIGMLDTHVIRYPDACLNLCLNAVCDPDTGESLR